MGVLMVGLVAAVIMVGDRTGLDRLLVGILQTEDPAAAPEDVNAEQTDFSGRVTRIVDGDTFWISSKDSRIRIWALTRQRGTTRVARRRRRLWRA